MSDCGTAAAVAETSRSPPGGPPLPSEKRGKREVLKNMTSGPQNKAPALKKRLSTILRDTHLSLLALQAPLPFIDLYIGSRL